MVTIEKTCDVCGRPPPRGERISRAGLCSRCAIKRVKSSIKAMATGKGEYADKWRKGMIEAAQNLEA
jgi:CRISPR/Cas system-associated protein Cas10 (large subunit of type III CRISPR-Cas system)